jgi:hypothetical protein
MASYVSFSPDGKWFATGTWKGTGVKVWSTQTWQPIQELPVDGNAICVFSPDGQWLVTSSGKECRLWKVPSWEAELVMSRDRAGDLPGMMAFSPDGRTLAYLHGRLSGVRLVSVPEGRELATLDTGSPLCFSPDGHQLATMEDNQRVPLVWDLRLIRQRLAAMKLDWDLPPSPPSKPSPKPAPLTLTVAPGKSVPALDLTAVPPRDPQTASNLIDLSQYYNAGFERNWHNLGPGEAPNDLASLPTGVQTLAGVPFDVRGLIQVGAQLGIEFPREVRGIVIGRSCRRVHFLHSAVHADTVPDGTAIGRYVVHFAASEPIAVPIVVGQVVANWWEPPAGTEPPLVLAWHGTNAAGHRVRLFKTAWENPRPAETVESIDLIGDRDRSAPFLVAITVE